MVQLTKKRNKRYGQRAKLVLSAYALAAFSVSRLREIKQLSYFCCAIVGKQTELKKNSLGAWRRLAVFTACIA